MGRRGVCTTIWASLSTRRSRGSASCQEMASVAISLTHWSNWCWEYFLPVSPLVLKINFLFWKNFRFTGKLQRGAEFLYTPRPVPCVVNVVHYHGHCETPGHRRLHGSINQTRMSVGFHQVFTNAPFPCLIQAGSPHRIYLSQLLPFLRPLTVPCRPWRLRSLTVLRSTGQVSYRTASICICLMFSSWLDWGYGVFKEYHRAECPHGK